MRILLANKFLFRKGGAERAVLTLGEELERRGHAVAWFGMSHPDNVPGGPAVEWVTPRDYHRPGARRFADALAMLYSPQARARFARLLDRFRPDVVHAHNIYHQLTPSILDAARDRGVPVVMTLHDYKLVCPRYDMLRHGRPCQLCVDEGPTACVRHRCSGGRLGPSLLLAAESALHRARGSYSVVRAFVSPSRFLRRVLLRAGFEPGRVRHVPNFAPEAPPGDVDPHAERCAFVGRLSAEKGVETLVRAASRLERGQVMICGDGPIASRVKSLAAAAPPGRIVLRGWLDDAAVTNVVRECSFTVLPSEWFENAPFAALESMSLGRAVLASDLGGLPELVTDGVTGRLVPAGSVEAWARALEAAFASPERMRRFGVAAQCAARRDYALGRHVDGMLALYDEVMG
jgi:glycosyltransferase involved in cell wall biosynthesis